MCCGAREHSSIPFSGSLTSYNCNKALWLVKKMRALLSPSAASSSALLPIHLRFRSPPTSPNLTFPIVKSRRGRNALGLVAAATSSAPLVSDAYDPELRSVLELATDTELFELERILFGPSYFSPLFKSINNGAEVDHLMIGEDLQERDNFVEALESRFLFLAADARSTLRGWRPSYRNVLLSVRKKLNIPCASKLQTEDLEAEVFLYLVENYSSEESGIFPGLWKSSSQSNTQGSLELGLSKWKVEVLGALEGAADEIHSMILKGGGMITFSKIYQLLARKLSGEVFVEAAKYQMGKEMVKKAGHFAATKLESRAAVIAAKQGLAGAAARYLGLRTLMQFLGPMMWGTLLADIVIQMLGTDYARILRAIYAFAQIRITRTYRLPSE